MGNLPLIGGQRTPSFPKQINYCCCLPELEGKTFLMTAHTKDTELREIELKQTWKLLPED